MIRSWLLDLLVAALKDDGHLEQIRGYAEDSGEGRWTVEAAIDNAVPMHVIAASLFARFTSRQDDSPAMKAVAAMRKGFGGHATTGATPAGTPAHDRRRRLARRQVSRRLYVAHLSLHDFRSYPGLEVDLEPGVTSFVGRNGQGKTNIVEAIDYLSRLSSHRVAADLPLVRRGADPGRGARGRGARRAPGGARGRDQPRQVQPRPGQPRPAAAGPRAARPGAHRRLRARRPRAGQGRPDRAAQVRRRPAGAAPGGAVRRHPRRLRPGAQAAQLAAQDRPGARLASGRGRRSRRWRSGTSGWPGSARRSWPRAAGWSTS